ncbi:unnamed protein product [Rhodiola kirilowii]
MNTNTNTTNCFVYVFFFFFFSVLLLQVSKINAAALKKCDYFQGNWVRDTSGAYSLYNQSTCPFVQSEFNCQKNGRPDRSYLAYRWEPLCPSCSLARFNASNFMSEVMRGKTMMFVGDSLSRNQWESLLCMIHSSLPTATYTITFQGEITIYTFPYYDDARIMLDRNVFLVDVVTEKVGRVLKLDSIEGGKRWLGIDYLIFNTWHWWNRRGSSQPWDFIQVGREIRKDMDRTAAFGLALTTWARWVESNVNPNKTTIFYQGISPSHYNGSEWGEPRVTSCQKEQQPLLSTTYPGGLPPALGLLRNVLAKIKRVPVHFLDVTNLSLLRKDGHPSVYGLDGRLDCSHWCLAGVPDTWNIILYNMLVGELATAH